MHKYIKLYYLYGNFHRYFYHKVINILPKGTEYQDFKHMSKIIVIEGPTAVGKSGVAVGLAQHFGCCVIGADSRQVYRELSIGTAVATEEEMRGVEHYFVQDRSVVAPLSAGAYEREAVELIDRLSEGRGAGDVVAVVAGGSGLYVDALLGGLDDIPGDRAVKERLQNRLETEGVEVLLEELHTKDPEYYINIDPKNPQRLIRALEAIEVSGQRYSTLRKNCGKERTFTHQRIVLELPREELYQRINTRVDIMLEQGLLEEVRSVEKYRDLQALQTVGYREFFEHFDGVCTLPHAIDKVKQHSRNYAKRQETWLRRSAPTAPRFSPHNLPEILKNLSV